MSKEYRADRYGRMCEHLEGLSCREDFSAPVRESCAMAWAILVHAEHVQDAERAALAAELERLKAEAERAKEILDPNGASCEATDTQPERKWEDLTVLDVAAAIQHCMHVS